MTHHSRDTPQFYLTAPSPCPYLPGKTERKVFTELTGQHSAELNDALGRIGFRRSQGVAYFVTGLAEDPPRGRSAYRAAEEAAFRRSLSLLRR